MEDKPKKEYPVGEIHKLTVGVNCQKYYIVGIFNEAVKGTICRIFEDKNSFVEDSIKTYLVIAKDDDGIEFLADEVENMPVVKTYSRPKKGDAIFVNATNLQ